jgi:hypothetical protein
MMKKILKLKKLLNSLLYHLRSTLPEAWKPLLFKPPAGTTQTEEYCRNRNLSFQKLQSLRKVRSSLPSTIEPDIHWKFRRVEYHAYPETWVAELKEASIVGPYGHILTPERLLLTDGSLQLGSQNPSKHKLFTEYVTFPKKRHLKGLTTVLTGPSYRGYFHWLTDSLPRLQLIESAGYSVHDIDNYIIPCGNLPAIDETLDSLEIDVSKRVEATHRANLTTDTLILPSMPAYSGNPSPESRKFLRDRFLKRADTLQHNFPKRFYVSRKDTRRVINEPELLNALHKYGIKALFPEKFSFLEQVALFSRADLIIAPHGAALTNLLFAKPGTTVLEFFSPNYVNVCYWSISKLGKLRYSYLLGKGSNPPEYCDPHRVRENIEIPVSKVVQWLKTHGLKRLEKF